MFRRIGMHAIRASLCFALGLASASANSVPVQMTAVTTLGGLAGIPGTTSGDMVTISVVVDNNGSSLLSQDWARGDIVSGRVDVGTYTAFFVPLFFIQSAFATDDTGMLTVAFFADTLNDGMDDDGALFTNAVQDEVGNKSFFGSEIAQPNTNIELWSVAFVSVPEPGTLVLFGAGLIGLCAAQTQPLTYRESSATKSSL